MAVKLKFEREELERLVREEVARKFHLEVASLEWIDEDGSWEDHIEVKLGGLIPRAVDG